MKPNHAYWKRLLPVYEAGLLEPEDRRRLEEHLLECAECAADVYEMIPVIETVRGTEYSQQLASDFETSRSFVRMNWRWIMSAAAITIVLSCAFMIFWQRFGPVSSEASPANFHAVFEKLTGDRLDLAIRQASDNETFREALLNYQQGDCSRCVDLASQGLAEDPGDPGLLLLTVRCLVRADRAEKALGLLHSHPLPSQSPFQEDARWLELEALIRLDRMPEATACLEELAARPGKYQEAARQLLIPARRY